MKLSNLMLQNFIQLKQKKIGELPTRESISDLPPDAPGVCIALVDGYYQIMSTVSLAIHIHGLNKSGITPFAYIEANNRVQANRLESALWNVFESKLVERGIYGLSLDELDFIQDYQRYINQCHQPIDYDVLHKNVCDKRRGENAPNWKGGISFDPYCFKFNDEFKERIREKFSRKCYLCAMTEDNTRLPVHHIDYNKNSICNGKEWAFLPLCQKHHAKTNFNRWYWFNLLINYWAMNEDIRLRN